MQYFSVVSVLIPFQSYATGSGFKRDPKESTCFPRVCRAAFLLPAKEQTLPPCPLPALQSLGFPSCLAQILLVRTEADASVSRSVGEGVFPCSPSSRRTCLTPSSRFLLTGTFWRDLWLCRVCAAHSTGQPSSSLRHGQT